MEVVDPFPSEDPDFDEEVEFLIELLNKQPDLFPFFEAQIVGWDYMFKKMGDQAMKAGWHRTKFRRVWEVARRRVEDRLKTGSDAETNG